MIHNCIHVEQYLVIGWVTNKYHPYINFANVCLSVCLSVTLLQPVISPQIHNGSSQNFHARPSRNQQIIRYPSQPSKPYPTLPYHPTLPYYPILPLLPYNLYLYLYYITIFLTFTFFFSCLSQPYHTFTPTIPFPLFTLTLSLPLLPYTSFSITLKPIDRFTSNFQVMFSLT